MGFFDQTEYDASIFEEIKANYTAGETYQIQKSEWQPDVNGHSYKRRITVECPTLKDFEIEVWDLFADFAAERTVEIVWGAPNGLQARNPHRMHEPYCDGLIFYTIRKEFMECIANQNISRFVSVLKHWGLDYLSLIVMQPAKI